MPPAPIPSLRRLTAVFGKIGLISFGGPAGQIGLMHRVLVEEQGWIDEDGFLRALNFCTLLPGPEAQQLATYIGWRLRGVAGGLIAGLLFILPGAAVILCLSLLYAYAAGIGSVSAAFLGVKAAVLAIVIQAMIRLSRRVLNTPLKRVIAAAAFLSLFFLHAPFPLVVLSAGLIGALTPPRLLALKPPGAPQPSAKPLAPQLIRAARTALTWLLVWAAPLGLVFALLGPGHVLFQLGLFFAKMAMVTFGGAYAVLSYMGQQAVGTYHWLAPGQMVDGLGLAETTPGPLILVTEFVGFLAAFRHPVPFTPLIAGLLGAGLTLWMTFAPCFLWIFVGAPFVERLEHARRLQGALAAISAAVVGVIANLALWFGLHVLFKSFSSPGFGLEIPALRSLDWTAAGLAVIAAVLLLRFKLGVVQTLGVSVALGLLLFALGLT